MLRVECTKCPISPATQRGFCYEAPSNSIEPPLGTGAWVTGAMAVGLFPRPVEAGRLVLAITTSPALRHRPGFRERSTLAAPPLPLLGW